MLERHGCQLTWFILLAKAGVVVSFWPVSKLRSACVTFKLSPEWLFGVNWDTYVKCQLNRSYAQALSHSNIVCDIKTGGSNFCRPWRALIWIWVNPKEPTQVKTQHSLCPLESLQTQIYCSIVHLDICSAHLSERWGTRRHILATSSAKEKSALVESDHILHSFAEMCIAQEPPWKQLENVINSTGYWSRIS